jgi:formylglycine-generating enzyme required for sulfatase activity
MGMILIPKGEFLMGAAETDKNAGNEEKPQHSIYLSDYYIDLTEVTNGMYRACVEAGVCTVPKEGRSFTREHYYNDSDFDNYPVVNVDWNQASTYCAWRGARLPSEAEWEKAARGTDGRIFPWGSSFDGQLANFCDQSCPLEWADINIDDGYPDTSPVDSYTGGASPYGLLNMAGNVYEWVQDWYLDTYYPISPFENPLGPPYGEYHSVRGGSWSDGSIGLRVTYRSTNAATDYGGSMGFRCAYSP